MPTSLPPLSPWQFYNASIRRLGVPRLSRLYNKGPREVYRWAANPRTCEDKRNSPLDLIMAHLELLMDMGEEDLARAAVAILARIVECRLEADRPVLPDKASLERECLDDLPAVASYHGTLLDDNAFEAEVVHRLHEAVRELK